MTKTTLKRKAKQAPNLVRIFGEGDFPIENEKCWPNEHSGYDGFALTWGMTFRTKTAGEVAILKHLRTYVAKEQTRGQCFSTPVSACRVTVVPRRLKKLLCNIWVYCPPNEKRDGKMLEWGHSDHEQLRVLVEKIRQTRRSQSPQAAGEYPEAHLQEHKTSPEVVQWLSGAIVNQAKRLLLEILIGGWPRIGDIEKADRARWDYFVDLY